MMAVRANAMTAVFREVLGVFFMILIICFRPN
jgi:hypothetical protein